MPATFQGLKNNMGHRPLLSYFVFSYAFFWLFLLLFALFLELLHLNPGSLPSWVLSIVMISGSWMPTLAAVIMTYKENGRNGIKGLFQKYIHFKLASKWYIAAFIPFPIAFASVALFKLFGGAPEGGANLSLHFWITLVVVNILTGPTGEEAGWRGYALPKLLERYSPLKSGILLGIVWNFWHLPLWLTIGYSGLNLLYYIFFFSVGLISLSVLMTWIYCRTSASLVPMVIIHFSFNTGLYLIGPAGLGLGATLPLLAIMSFLCVLVAFYIWISGGLYAQQFA
jgi:membrane protease YdiL (CAAX protease family)